MTTAEASASVHYSPLLPGSRYLAAWLLREATPSEPPRPRLLDRVRQALRARHMSRRTEEAYVAWVRRYGLLHGKRHPAEMGAPEITRFLTWLAVDRKVAASTQNQALSALLFLYGEVLEVDVPWLDDLVRARRPQRLPVVLTRDEVRAVLRHMEGVPRLMASLLYGAGLRLLECCCLRVQDVDFATNQIVVRAGGSSEPVRPDVPMTTRRALGHGRAGIGCGALRPIRDPRVAGWTRKARRGGRIDDDLSSDSGEIGRPASQRPRRSAVRPNTGSATYGACCALVLP